jgi:uncharacterized YccA/Bax inhibitor family protein
MALFGSGGNPILTERRLQQAGSQSTEGSMTVNGTTAKTAFLLLLVVAAAIYAWGAPGRNQDIMPLFFGGLIAGIILFIVIMVKNEWAQYLAPAYALAKGFTLGIISVLYEGLYDGIIYQAVGLTFGVFAAMLILYRTGIIRVTERFKAIVFTAMAGIAIFYMMAFVLHFFNINIPFLHDSSVVGVIFSLVVITVAALRLTIDFDFVHQGVMQRAPKHVEWLASFGMLVTLVWLYLEILKLLARLSRR